MNHLLSITDLDKKQINNLIRITGKIKKHPKKYYKNAYQKTLMTIFQLPSLRTQVSFQAAMQQLGGNVIDYHAEHSPWQHGKESIEDVGRVISRYVDVAMFRIKEHTDIVKLAEHSSIPIINGLTSLEHPCQVLSDLFTIKEKLKKCNGLKLAYLGDGNNNVTHSLLLGCALMGISIAVGCPSQKEYCPDASVVQKAKQLAQDTNASLSIDSNPVTAIKDADVVYTDSWMSYAIPKSKQKNRIKIFKKYQVTAALMKKTHKKSIFMHCLPAKRGMEVTTEVIDGSASVVFDQAENRLHMQKAILLHLLSGKKR